MIANRILNVALKCATSCCKFLLVIFLAKYLEPEDVGAYGFLLATAASAAILLGADLYNYTHRFLVTDDLKERGRIASNFASSLAVSYFVALPLLLLLFWVGYIDTSYLLWFYALLVVDHISDELSRILIVLDKQLMAGFQLFIRSGVWVLLVIPAMHTYSELRVINLVLGAWLSSSIVSVLFGAYCLRREFEFPTGFKVSFVWIKSAFSVGLIYMFSSVLVKALFSVDKFLLQQISGEDILGVYVFYFGISMGVMGLVEPAVFSFQYPRLLRAALGDDAKEFSKAIKSVFVNSVAILAILFFGLILTFSYMADFFGRDIYIHFKDDFVYVALVAMLFLLSKIPHFVLYALKKDKEIFFIHLVSVGFFFLCFIFFLDYEISPLVLVSTSLGTSFSIIFLLKLFLILRVYCCSARV